MDDFTRTRTVVSDSEKKVDLFGEVSLPQKGDLVAERYEVLSVLGRGGSSVVYLCYDSALRRQVALKLLVKANPESEARLRREALLGSKWEHPHLLRLYDLGRHNSMLFVTMPVAEGGTVADKIAKKEISSFDEILKFSKEVLEGLSVLHKEGFIHRDIKPSNIFFDKEGNSRLGDFGIVFSTTETRYTSDGLLVGTPQYMSPEYLTGRALNPSSDLWSLGITIKEAVDILKEKGESVPIWFEKWLSGLLQQEQKRRFQDAERALVALNERLTPPHILRKRWLAFAGIFLLAVFTLVFYFILSKFYKEKLIPDFVKYEGNSISAYDENNNLLWKLDLKGKIAKTEDWGKSAKSTGRFMVLYGGAFQPEQKDNCPPTVAIISSKGKVISEIEPLTIFNPFKKDFSEDYFHIENMATDDFDSDGYPESLIKLTHNMYPEIIYQVSSLESKITGGLANSGHIYSCFTTAPKNNLKWTILIGINNKIGHQGIVTTLGPHLKKFYVSPDMDNDDGKYVYLTNYRPFGILDTNQISFSGGDYVQLKNSKGKELYYHHIGILSSHPNIENNPSVREGYVLDNFYISVRRVSEIISSGKTDEAFKEAEKVIKSAPDEYLKFYAQNILYSNFLENGFLVYALKCLPEKIESCPNPDSAAIKMGNVLILLKKYKEAKQILCKSSLAQNLHPWYYFLPYSSAVILEGISAEDYYEDIKRNFSEYAESSATKAFVVQIALLQGEIEKGINFEEGIKTNLGVMSSKYEDEVLFPCFYSIWRAFADICLSDDPKTFPKLDEVEKSFSEERMAEYKFLLALREFKRLKDKTSLEELKKSYLMINKKSETDSSMVVPYAISSYIYGFSCYEMGETKLAKEVLKEAVKLYPYGNLAEKAKKII